MTTPPTYPFHLACLAHDDEGHVFFTLYSLMEHLHREHERSFFPDLCRCGHQRQAHVPNKRAYCQAADPKPCPCSDYIRGEVAA